MEIELNHGYKALIDDADAALVAGRTWYAHKIKKYVYPSTCVGEKTLHLHRFLMGEPAGMVVDHIDGNPLNCTRANLRICTARENGLNSKKSAGKSSIYKGVSKHSREGYGWQSKIVSNGRHYFLGLFKSEKAAALAYNRAARRLFGEFAKLNEVSRG